MKPREPHRFELPDAVARTAGLLKQGRTQIESVVSGGSMLPALESGERIRIRCGAGSVDVGAVVAWVAGDAIVTHRVVRRWPRRSLLMTRGDGSSLPDPPIPDDLVLGVVEGVFRGDVWAPVPEATAPPGLRGRTALALDALFAAATTVSPRAARGVHAVLYGSGRVWARARGAGRSGRR